MSFAPSQNYCFPTPPAKAVVACFESQNVKVFHRFYKKNFCLYQLVQNSCKFCSLTFKNYSVGNILYDLEKK